jgi:hypothetical protein
MKDIQKRWADYDIKIGGHGIQPYRRLKQFSEKNINIKDYYENKKSTTALSIYKNKNPEIIISKPVSFLEPTFKNKIAFEEFQDNISHYELKKPDIKCNINSHVINNNSFSKTNSKTEEESKNFFEENEIFGN